MNKGTLNTVKRDCAYENIWATKLFKKIKIYNDLNKVEFALNLPGTLVPTQMLYSKIKKFMIYSK